jgi:hypothetical protein
VIHLQIRFVVTGEMTKEHVLYSMQCKPGYLRTLLRHECLLYVYHMHNHSVDNKFISSTAFYGDLVMEADKTLLVEIAIKLGMISFAHHSLA